MFWPVLISQSWNGGAGGSAAQIVYSILINPVGYENGEEVFSDMEYDIWNMHPEAIEGHFNCISNNGNNVFGMIGNISKM